MGTENEKPTSDGNAGCCPFEIDGPDGDGFVWLRWQDPDGKLQSLNQGSYDLVADGLAEWLSRTDFGEHAPARAKVSVTAGAVV